MNSHKSFIRNFCIIAHIDHGKSTLADRFLEITQAIDKRNFYEQFLDNMELERERGITIKAKAVRLSFKSKDGHDYILNLIDTPGHVDFTYEVAKSLKACEGAILLVDASQGIEAQTVANFYLALENNLKIIPVINKIDLPNADIDRTIFQLQEVFGFKKEEISLISAKVGRGVNELLERIVKEILPPSGSPDSPLKAILFDSSFDVYKGVILFVRIFEGRVKINDTILLMHKQNCYKVEELGVFLPRPLRKEELIAGEVGYLCCNIKNPQDVDIGDTITLKDNPCSSPFSGYKKIPPIVFCGIFPSSPKDYPQLREAIQKLRLSDSSFVYEPDNLGSLGYGFRCGFLGLLHMEIVQERLEREFGLDLILTSPNVMYTVKKTNGEIINVESPHQLPPPTYIQEVYEPFVKVSILTPLESMEAICQLSKSRRGKLLKIDYLGKDRLNIIFELPLSEIIVDFYDKIKSVTHGYASLDYEFIGYKKTDIVKIDILFNRKFIEAFSLLVHKDEAESKARSVVTKLKELIPRQMFEVNIQAAIGSKIIASERIPPLRKNVTAKCYGGDITRKRKLWERQKKGKKRMKQLGNITIPKEAFLEVLKM
ncbi:MAG: translation elongation factor 4 [Candidatus Omnitrophica bacterium]|nr:translation elongation factor 4 [Candidatus Omnitrophota bacterium]